MNRQKTKTYYYIQVLHENQITKVPHTYREGMQDYLYNFTNIKEAKKYIKRMRSSSPSSFKYRIVKITETIELNEWI